MSHIKFSSPFIKGFKQYNTVVDGSAVVLAKAEPHERRTVVILQNQSGDGYATLLLDNDNTEGLLVPPLGSITFDNYNGLIKVNSSGTILIHIAYAIA